MFSLLFTYAHQVTLGQRAGYTFVKSLDAAEFQHSAGRRSGCRGDADQRGTTHFRPSESDRALRATAKLRDDRAEAVGPNDVRAMDFVHVQLAPGKTLRRWTVIPDG